MLKLLFFGRLGDFAEGLPEQVAWSQSLNTPAAIRDNYCADNPALVSELRQPQVLVAVNQHIVDWDSAVNDGDEVAFLPPVTGLTSR